MLTGPTLIEVPGERGPALFVSVLLHGNETSGWDALRSVLQNESRPPRHLRVFVGNVEAAAAGVRHLPEQPDYNRIWRDYSGPERTFELHLRLGDEPPPRVTGLEDEGLRDAVESMLAPLPEPAVSGPVPLSLELTLGGR